MKPASKKQGNLMGLGWVGLGWVGLGWVGLDGKGKGEGEGKEREGKGKVIEGRMGRGGEDEDGGMGW